MNAYEVKAGIGVIAVTLCDPCLSAFEVSRLGAILIHFTFSNICKLEYVKSTYTSDLLHARRLIKINFICDAFLKLHQWIKWISASVPSVVTA